MQVFYTVKTKYILPKQSVFSQMTEGERIRSVRGTMKYAEFAEPLGTGVSNISNIEKGRSRLSLDLAIQIAKVYNVSLDWLLLGKESKGMNEPPADYIKSNATIIDKDELIELQRLALKNTIAEQKQQEVNSEAIKNI